MATYLTPEKVTHINFGPSTAPLILKQRIIPDTAIADKDIASYVKKGQKMKPCRLLGNASGRARGICVHNTEPIKVAAATTMSEQYSRAMYPNCNLAGVMVHMFACDKEAWQNLAVTEQGWHAADGSMQHKAHNNASYPILGGNLDTVAVEIIGKESEENGAKLVAYLLAALNLKIEDVYTHNYFMSYKYNATPSDVYRVGAQKNCPVYILDHWDIFLEKVSRYLDLYKKYNKPTTTTPTTPTSTSTSTSTTTTSTPSNAKLYRVQVGAFSSKGNAEKQLTSLKAKGYDGYITKPEGSKTAYYRVQVGAYTNKGNAQTMQSKLKKSGFEAIIVTP